MSSKMRESSFFAYISRMKLIKRWALMRNIQEENISEHSHQVAVIAHGLAVIANKYFDRQVDTGQVVLLALYHDAGEAVIGDLPTPVKYYDPYIKSSYGRIENIACEKLLSFLPQEMAEEYRPLFFPNEESYEYRLLKAADKVSAYVKALEETAAGNREFLEAKESIGHELEKYSDMPEVGWFMEYCVSAFAKSLDELG